MVEGVNGVCEVISELLTNHLKDYAEHRRRWPLWTYNRAPYQRSVAFGADGEFLGSDETPDSWRQCPAWVERLRWSPLLPYLALVSRFARAAEANGCVMSRPPEPGEDRIPVFRQDNPGPPVSGARYQLKVESLPPIFKLLSSALFASVAIRVPARVQDLEWPTQ